MSIYRGLDSSSSLAVVKALNTVASSTNMTICCVIHQPRFEILSKLFLNHILRRGDVIWLQILAKEGMFVSIRIKVID